METIFKQITEFWKQLGAGQRISLMASILAIFVGLTLLLYWASRPHFQLLYGGLASKEMSEVVSTLEEQGIPYQMADGGRSVMVPYKSVYNVRMRLAEKGVPSGGGVGYEIFDRSYFGISDFMQKTNYMRALQGELSRTIGELNGIRNARVMIVIPENKLLSTQAKIRPTASVFVDTGGNNLPEAAVNSIRSLVANSVEGLSVDDVSVVDNHGKVLSEDLGKSGAFGAASSHMKMRENLESYFGKKIESMLHSVIGEGKVVARVSVDLETSATTVVEEKYDPESQVVRSQTYQENSLSNNESNSSQGAVEAKDAAANGQGTSTEAMSKETRKNRTVAYDINKSTREVVAAPGTIKKVTAAVFIALRYSDKERTQPSPRSEKEIQSLTSMVANALGIENLNRVSVQEVAFDVSEKFVASVTGMSLSEKLVNWASLLKNFFALGVSVFLLWFFLRMVKNSKPSGNASFELMEISNTGSEKVPSFSFQQPSPAMLNELIKQKPENVSVALKEWMRAPKVQ